MNKNLVNQIHQKRRNLCLAVFIEALSLFQTNKAFSAKQNKYIKPPMNTHLNIVYRISKQSIKYTP